MLHQLSFIEQAPSRPPISSLPILPTLPDNPTAIVVSVSGGLDSAACAIWARQRWPDRSLILWHAHLAEMDWPHTDAQLRDMAAPLGNCRLISVQAIYALNGEITSSGANGTTLRRLHTVRDGDQWCGPAQDDDPAAILTLLDFAWKARNGQPPTSKLCIIF